MKRTIIEHLDRLGQRSEVDAELAANRLTRKTLNDPVNRQRIITVLEQRFPEWRESAPADEAEQGTGTP